MPPQQQQQTTLLSPAELSYLHTSLSLTPPIRPDARTPTQFRPLSAETDVLPGTNGSAHLSFTDGSEAIVGIKAEVERSKHDIYRHEEEEDVDMDDGNNNIRGENEWLEMSIEIPGFRDDDALPVFLSEMMREALLAGGGLTDRLVINRGWHWRIYIDILLLSPPASYPLPLLSLTTHLALLSTRLPRLKSQGEEDPLFDDDWDAATHLYPSKGKQSSTTPSSTSIRPPITLLAISVGFSTILFDPSPAELAVADTVVAISVGGDAAAAGGLKVLAIRTVDPPGRTTQPGVGDGNSEESGGVWRPPRGGVKRAVVARMVKMVVERGGVGEEVLEGLEGFRDGG